MRTSKHRRYDDECGGEFFIHVTPGGSSQDYHVCGAKYPMRIRVTGRRIRTWTPPVPLCLATHHNPNSPAGRRAAADAAAEFFAYKRCSRGQHLTHTRSGY